MENTKDIFESLKKFNFFWISHILSRSTSKEPAIKESTIYFISSFEKPLQLEKPKIYPYREKKHHALSKVVNFLYHNQNSKYGRFKYMPSVKEIRKDIWWTSNS